MENEPKETVIESIVSETYTCWKCGEILETDDIFCPNCGSKRGEKPKKYCDKCGAEIEEGQAFCTNCGKTKKYSKKKLITIISVSTAVILCIVLLCIFTKPIEKSWARDAAKMIDCVSYLDSDNIICETYVSPKFTTYSNSHHAKQTVRYVYVRTNDIIEEYLVCVTSDNTGFVYYDTAYGVSWHYCEKSGDRYYERFEDKDTSTSSIIPSENELQTWTKVNIQQDFGY